MARIVVSATLIVFVSIAACGQEAAEPARFEVASVRPNRSGMRGGSMDFAPGGERFTATNMPLGALILTAYNITVRQLSSTAALLSEPYDVAAKAEQAVAANQMLLLLQALLADRFDLVVHRETKEMPVYALIAAKGGPKLHRSDAPASDGAAPRTPTRAGGTELRSGHLIFKDESMPDLAWALSRTGGIGDRVVVDQTGLTGRYDFELKFGREDAAAPSDEPVLFSALDEQLGLKLESRKAPVEFLIVDHVERPTEN